MSEYVKQKIKECLNHILIKINQNNPTDILKSAKNLYEKIYTKEATSKAATTEFLRKVPNWKKESNEQFNFYEPKISLDVVAKFKNSQTNDKFPGNDGQTEEIYKHFSNALTPAL